MYDTGDDKLIILHSVNDDMLANFERAYTRAERLIEMSEVWKSCQPLKGLVQSISITFRLLYAPFTRRIQDDIVKILCGAGGKVNPHQGITSLLGTSPAFNLRIADSQMRSRSSGV